MGAGGGDRSGGYPGGASWELGVERDGAGLSEVVREVFSGGRRVPDGTKCRWRLSEGWRGCDASWVSSESVRGVQQRAGASLE
jgi:hypothetical protein